MTIWEGKQIGQEIEKLLGTKVENPEEMSREAAEVIKEYFSGNPQRQWEMTCPTYRSKVDRAEFMRDWVEWRKGIERIEIQDLVLNSGVSAQASVKVYLRGNKDPHICRISLIKESDPYKIDESKPFRVVGNTAPPYRFR